MTDGRRRSQNPNRFFKKCGDKQVLSKGSCARKALGVRLQAKTETYMDTINQKIKLTVNFFVSSRSI